jgi:hypothetical protein
MFNRLLRNRFGQGQGASQAKGKGGGRGGGNKPGSGPDGIVFAPTRNAT